MTSALTPNIKAAERFLQALDPSLDQFTFQTIDDNKARSDRSLARTLHGSLAEHLDQLIKAQQRGAGVFVTINKCDGAGRKNANVVGVRAHFVDLDGAPLEPVVTSQLPPHIVVESSCNKWHCYWLVDACPLELFKERQVALANQFDGDRVVCDLARVMRLPGFWHQKATPFQTRLVTPL